MPRFKLWLTLAIVYIVTTPLGYWSGRECTRIIEQGRQHPHPYTVGDRNVTIAFAMVPFVGPVVLFLSYELVKQTRDTREAKW